MKLVLSKANAEKVLSELKKMVNGHDIKMTIISSKESDLSFELHNCYFYKSGNHIGFLSNENSPLEAIEFGETIVYDGKRIAVHTKSEIYGKIIFAIDIVQNDEIESCNVGGKDMKMNHEAIRSIIESRIGDRTLRQLASYSHCDTMLPEWQDFMDGKNCSKLAMTSLLFAVGVIIKYGNDLKITRKLAKFNGYDADGFIDYVNQLNINITVFFVNQDEYLGESSLSKDPIKNWMIPDVKPAQQEYSLF